MNGGDLPQITADASLLRHVFVNLLSNALKFTRNAKQAAIHVGCESRARELVFFIRDNGAGFDMARFFFTLGAATERLSLLATAIPE